MAGAKEIRTKIKSIQSIKKTTKAMQMVSASKMRKTQEAMLAARPYAQEILHIAGHIVKSNPEYKHPYMEQRKIRRVGYIIVSTDRGLCGGLNTTLFKAILADMQVNANNHIETQVVTFGSKAEAFFKRVKTKVVASTSHLGDRPSSYDLIGGVKVMLDAYDQCEVDKVYLCYNQFVNTMTLKPTLQQILPVAPLAKEDLVHQHQWDYIYEPEPRKLLEFLLQRFVESQVYQAVTENIASEQAARMVAMKSATDNAVEVIDELKLVYNKARQASITQELSEIVAGAAAV